MASGSAGLPMKRSSNEPGRPNMSSEPDRLLVFKYSDHHQFSLTDILQKSIFTDIDPHSTLTTKTTGCINKRKVTLINTPNLTDYDLRFKTRAKKGCVFLQPRSTRRSPYTQCLQHPTKHIKDAEKRIQKELLNLEKESEKEVQGSRMEALEEPFSGEDLKKRSKAL